MIRNKHVLCAFRLIIGGLFIYAGVLKIADPLGFARDIQNYRILPPAACLFIALALPWFEALSGAFLIVGIFKRTSAWLLSFLLGGFIVLVIITMARGLDVDCGCFGSLNRKADWRLILKDALMLFMALEVALSCPGRRIPEISGEP
jgi:putative oxidoreductase